MRGCALVLSTLLQCALLGATASPHFAWAQVSPPPPTQPAASGQASRPYPESVSTILEDAGRVATLLTVIAGGVWVYFNFLRGRTYRPRLELEVSGAIHDAPTGSMLAATIRLRNVGLSRVGIKPEGTVYTVALPKHSLLVARPMAITEWTDLHVSHILSAHRWIEPGETITDDQLVALPGQAHTPYRVVARVVATQGTEWNAGVVVLPGSSERTPVPHSGGEHVK